MSRAEKLIDTFLEEMTRGMKNAYKKMEGKKVCSECGTVLPIYRGRYPSKCTECGTEWSDFNKE